MNANLFRLVFNAARGQVMAVSEVASSHSASTANSASNQPVAPVDIAQAAIKDVAFSVALLCAGWTGAAWSQAVPVTAVVVNTAAPAHQQPTLTSTASGIPQVNIQTAVGGVSRNRYTQMDVGSNGLILNNSPVNSNTQLAGWVAGNPQLASGSAAIILNEVNSANPTQLRGYIEVAGQRAEVVIANPSGIAVNGGGFINASGATLTTGTPQFSGSTLTGYQVNGGTITVTGTGLDTRNTGITTLQAQKIILQGGVFAQDLRVLGDNSAGTAGAIAIDTSAIGGMYANKITILATGSGAGVNNAGTLQASAGSLTLSADGTLTNTGTINSTATTRINADTVNNSTGGAIFGGSVAIAASTLNNAAATSAATAPAIAARDAAGRVDIGVTTLNNQEGALIYSAGSLNIGGSLDANGQATGRATTVTNNSATLEAASNVNIRTATLANTYASLSYRVVEDPNQPATIGSEGCGNECIHSWTDTYYSAQTIAGAHGAALIRAGADVNLDASTSALNSSSQILAAGTVNSTGSAQLLNRGIDLTDEVRTRRAHVTEQGYMDNEVGCWVNWAGIRLGCRSEHRISTSTSTEYIARNQTIAPALEQNHTSTNSTTALPNSALFATSSNASYLIQTNPAFTNKQIWLSSDYMLQALTVDPDITQKRMGDGFYEQRLINEQVAQLTGYTRLADYQTDEQQYQALMNAGITFAQAHQLRPGIALTAQQVAALTSDIVWLVQQEVTLQDGSKQKVLVPQVYAVARKGDLASNGALLGGPQNALISGNVLKLDATGEITNSHATLLGREVVSLSAENVSNLAGRIQGNKVDINATQDIENTGGAIIAQQSLIATAGRDLKVQSTTLDSLVEQHPTAAGSLKADGLGSTSTGGLQTRFSTISRVAGLYVTGEAGTLQVNVGRDVQLTAATLQSAGSTTVTAARNLTLDTVTTRQSLDATMDGGNYNRSRSSTEMGSTLQSKGNTTLGAGNDLIARAAHVQAADALNVTADNNIILQAGQSTRDQASARASRNSDFFTTTRTERQTTESSATAQVSSFSGQSTRIVAENTLVSIGADLQATGVQDGTGTLRVEGKNNTLLYEVQNTSQSSVTTHTKTGLGVALDPLGLGLSFADSDKTTTDQTASSVSVGTRLVSTQKIEIGVGNKIELRGTHVEAPEIVFQKTDPSKTGELILAGSINTTQTAHTEKTETAGMWQEMKGHGSTTQTLNQTQLQGNVTFDAALKITAQIPDSKGGEQLKSQINALAASSPAGLQYLNQLAANPNVQWDKVALAHENWRYEQAGLTPAGAAILTIVVTYFTAGMGTTAVGGAAATATTSATVMGSTALATAVNAGFSALASQAAVAMLNNNGDIGKTLEQLGSEQSVKNLLTTMVTAGALDKLNTAYFKDIGTTSKFGDLLLKNMTNNLASSAMDAAINGKPWDENALSSALSSALITTGMAQGANAIGNAASSSMDANGNRIEPQINAFTQKLAHAVVGCAAGAATAGNQSGCAPGAVGAVVGEMAAEFYTDKITHGDSSRLLTDAERADVVAFARVISATSGVISGGGGDNAQAVNIAATTGANAAENNFLSHQKLLARNAALDTLRKDADKNLIEKILNPTQGVLSAAEEATALQYIDKRSDALLAVYKTAPDKLSNAEKNELAVYLGDYARGNGLEAAQRLMQTGPQRAVESGDVSELMANASGLLRINAQQQGQAAIGNLALTAAPGGVGALLRLVQAAQSSTQLGFGIAEVADGQVSSGLMNMGLGLMGIVPVGAVEYQTSGIGRSPVKVGANGGAAKPLFGNVYPEHVIDPAKIVPTERLSGISGNFNYVITEQGNLIVGRSGHTSLTGGAPVQAAGELQLYNGKVKWIDNASGHYQPSSNIGSVAETAFNNAGLDATGKFVPKVWVPNPTLSRGGSWVKTN